MADNNHTDNWDEHAAVLALVRAFDDPLVPELYTVVLDQIKQLEPSSTIASLCALLAYPDPGVRLRAAEVLLEFDAEQHLPPVLDLLNDDAPFVRSALTCRLSEFGDARAVDALTALLLHEPDSTCRWYAVLALKHIGDVQAIPALNQAVQYDDGVNYEGTPIRQTAQAALTALQRKVTG